MNWIASCSMIAFPDCSNENLIHKLLAKGMAAKEIAALLDVSAQEVRRLTEER